MVQFVSLSGVSFFCPKLLGFGKCQGLLQLPKYVILACKVNFHLWQEGIPFYAVRCRCLGVVILPFSKELHLGELEGGLHPLGKINWVPRGGNFHQLWLPSWGLHLVGMPPHPLLEFTKGWLGHCRSVRLISSTARCLCPQQEFTHVRV